MAEVGSYADGFRTVVLKVCSLTSSISIAWKLELHILRSHPRPASETGVGSSNLHLTRSRFPRFWWKLKFGTYWFSRSRVEHKRVLSMRSRVSWIPFVSPGCHTIRQWCCGALRNYHQNTLEGYSSFPFLLPVVRLWGRKLPSGPPTSKLD